MHHLESPLDEALDGTFGGQGIFLHYDFPPFDEGIGLETGSAWSSRILSLAPTYLHKDFSRLQGTIRIASEGKKKLNSPVSC